MSICPATCACARALGGLMRQLVAAQLPVVPWWPVPGWSAARSRPVRREPG